jgi:cyclic pyranopterin phosphate synthase
MLRDVRISVTDRCNFRCTYCMPREIYGPGHAFLPQSELLTFAELERVARVFALAGARRIRITGGEPLLRPRLEELIARLAAIPEVEDIALTTNGVLLAQQASALKAAGLRRVTVSLDGLREEVFRAMSDTALSVQAVLDGIEAARACGFDPVKVNMVVRRGVNEGEVVPMAKKFAREGYVLRFIEYMDVGSTNGWRLQDVVPAGEILQTLGGMECLEELPPQHSGETARRYRLRGGAGEIGVISSVSEPFCRGCTRARVAANGRLHTCLFGAGVLDLRALIRAGLSDVELLERIRSAWAQRSDRYSELRASETSPGGKTEMSVLGG